MQTFIMMTIHWTWKRLLYTAVQVNAKSYLSFSCTCIEVSFMFIFNMNNIIGLYIEILWAVKRFMTYLGVVGKAVMKMKYFIQYLLWVDLCSALRYNIHCSLKHWLKIKYISKSLFFANIILSARGISIRREAFPNKQYFCFGLVWDSDQLPRSLQRILSIYYSFV